MRNRLEDMEDAMKKSLVLGILYAALLSGCGPEEILVPLYENNQENTGETESCKDECKDGMEKCIGGLYQVCGHFDKDTCTEWSEPDPCDHGCDESEKSCFDEKCSDECSENARKCSGDSRGYQMCTREVDGCTKWSNLILCEGEQTCTNGQCGDDSDPDKPCTPNCMKDARDCSGNGYRTCLDPNGDGCTVWSEVNACDSDEICQNGNCVENSGSCTDACTLGAKQCSGNSVQTCGDYNGDGCTEWGGDNACESGKSCSNGECVSTCTDACTSGAKQCSGNSVQTCGDYNSDGCTEWGGDSACGTGKACKDGECVNTCTNACTSGAKQCSGSSVQTCGDYNGDGCTEWGNNANCEHGCENGACKSNCVGGICPIVVTDFSKTISGNTSGSKNNITTYTGCGDQNESGPENYYEFRLNEPGYIFVATTEPSGGDVDVHLLTSLNAASCLARNDKMLMHRINSAGTYYVSVDTFGKSSNAGAYNLKITFIGDSSKCAMTATTEKRVSSCGNLGLPRIGQVVQEAHLVTDWDQSQHGSSWWPSSFTDGLAAHKAHSAEWTGLNVGNDWCPSGEGGCKYGQGCTGKAVPWKAEAWYINMYWSGSGRPAKGERYLVLNPYTGKAVVTAAGYESGPGDCSMMGGAVYEIHSYLGTKHKSSLSFGHLKNQSYEYGPIACE